MSDTNTNKQAQTIATAENITQPKAQSTINLPVKGSEYQSLFKKNIQLRKDFKELLSKGNLTPDLLCKYKLKTVLEIAPYILYIYCNGISYKIGDETITLNSIQPFETPVQVLQMMIHSMFQNIMGPNTQGKMGEYDSQLRSTVNSSIIDTESQDFEYWWVKLAQDYLQNNTVELSKEIPSYSTLISAKFSNLMLIDFYTFWISWNKTSANSFKNNVDFPRITINGKEVTLNISNDTKKMFVITYNYFVNYLQQIYDNWDSNTNSIIQNVRDELQKEISNTKKYYDDDSTVVNV